MLRMILTLLYLVQNFESGLASGIFPESTIVKPYEIAFFPCVDPNQGQPSWLIDGVEYFSAELIPDHTTNISGLSVFADPKYNNTIYQCRFVEVSIDENGFLDVDTSTSSPAVLTIEDILLTDPIVYTCEPTAPTTATYNYTSQLLTVHLDNNLTDDSVINMSLCNSETFQKTLNQNCSAIDVSLSPQVFNKLIIITFPPNCDGDPPPSLDYSVRIAIDFNFSATVPSSAEQQLDFSDKCLESRVYKNGQYPYSDQIQISLSANGKREFLNFYDENYFIPMITKESLHVCFKSTSYDNIRSLFGDVREVLIQEVGVVNLNDLCANPQSTNDNYGYVYGSKGILPLVSDGQEPLPENVCSLEDIVASSTLSPSSNPSPSQIMSISSTMSGATTSNTPEQTTVTFQPLPSPSPPSPLPSSPSSSPSPNPFRIIIIICVGVAIIFAIFLTVVLLILFVIHKNRIKNYCQCGQHSQEMTEEVVVTDINKSKETENHELNIAHVGSEEDMKK